MSDVGHLIYAHLCFEVTLCYKNFPLIPYLPLSPPPSLTHCTIGISNSLLQPLPCEVTLRGVEGAAAAVDSSGNNAGQTFNSLSTNLIVSIQNM
jgi:hypothetical protein